MTLPTDYAARKALPIFEGVLMYFPDAIAAVAAVSEAGNRQHNPGEPLHWARDKSTDQFNTAVRHLLDHRTGGRYDIDKTRHLAKAAWRVLAALQLDIEAEQLTATQQQSQNPSPTWKETDYGKIDSCNPQQNPDKGIRRPGPLIPD
jgi:Domain of unknown function (DUF5664)